MAKLIDPIHHLEFSGVVTAGHPLLRPQNASKVCENFRVMPGNWLRLRSGRKARMYNGEGTFLQFVESFKLADKLVQFDDGTTVTWQSFNLTTWVFDPFFDRTIDANYGGSFASSEAAPVSKIRTQLMYYNGLGVRDATNSRPPFWLGTRYCGLDAYTQGGNPTASFAAGAGYNEIITSVQIFVGIYNESTGHYSNGVYAGTITTTGATGTITVSNLSRLKFASNSAGELAELHFVFYATVDGGSIPYLIFNSAINGPYAVDNNQTSASLSIYNGGNGWVLNLDGPMPTDNHPPRPMRDIAYVNGRVYGVPLSGGGSGSGVLQQRADGTSGLDFTYQPGNTVLNGVVYSKAASDVAVKNLLGNPEESYPLTNFTPTPNSEIPVKLAEHPDGFKLLVYTATSSFWCEESVDGFHEWWQISELHGIDRKECFCETPYGVVWLTQRKQLAILRPGSSRAEIISDPYQSLLSGRTSRFMTYVTDPLNEVDRVDIFFSDGAVHHDFRLANRQFPDGQAYTSTSQDYTAGATLTNTVGQQYFIVAKTNVYSREGQPDESGAIVTYDEDYTGPTTKAKSNFTGTVERHWEDYGDDSLRKEFAYIDIIGDPDVKLEWYANHEFVDASTAKPVYDPTREPQVETYNSWRFKPNKCNVHLFKPVLKLTGNYSKGLTYDHPSEQGSLADNFIGCIAKLRPTVSVKGGNRG